MAAERQISFGVIGAGEIVRHCAHVFKINPRIRCLAVADLDRERVEKVGAELGARKITDDWKELLRMGEIEAVYIATPPNLHRDMIWESIQAGKHVVCEKPFVLNSTQMAEIQIAADAKKELKIASCSSRFLQKAAVTAREVVQSGRLGKLDRVGFILSREGLPTYPNWTGWKAEASKSGGGLVMDWGCYDLDWMSWVLGDQFWPRRVFATLGNVRNGLEATFAVQIILENGVRIDWQRRGPEIGPAKEVVEIRGSEGGLDVAPVPSARGPKEYRWAETKVQWRETGTWLRDWKEAVAYPIQDLADAIVENREPISPPRRQAIVHRVIDAVYRSERSGQVVEM